MTTAAKKVGNKNWNDCKDNKKGLSNLSLQGKKVSKIVEQSIFYVVIFIWCGV